MKPMKDLHLFFSLEEILLDINMLPISTPLKVSGDIDVFQFEYHKTL